MRHLLPGLVFLLAAAVVTVAGSSSADEKGAGKNPIAEIYKDGFAISIDSALANGNVYEAERFGDDYGDRSPQVHFACDGGRSHKVNGPGEWHICKSAITVEIDWIEDQSPSPFYTETLTRSAFAAGAPSCTFPKLPAYEVRAKDIDAMSAKIVPTGSCRKAF